MWTRDMVWRYPLPDNVGIELEVDRGNVVNKVQAKSPASSAGLKAGDVVRRLGGVPVHSFGDAQFALDRAPATGSIAIVWRRGGKNMEAKLALAASWRKCDITWRPSMQRMVPSAGVYGRDLTAAQKKALGLSARQLAFRENFPVQPQAAAAGIRTGDIILGVDGKRLETDADGFLRHVERHYLVGDRVTVNLLRGGKRLDLPMKLR